jgi:hypothetical protein
MTNGRATIFTGQGHQILGLESCGEIFASHED